MFIAHRYGAMPYPAILQRLGLIGLLGILAACGGESTQTATTADLDCNASVNNSLGPPNTTFGPTVTGISLSAPKPIEEDEENFGTDPSIATAVVNGQVYVYLAWSGFGQQGTQIFFARSVNGGVTFEPSITVSGTQSTILAKPLLGAAENHVYVVWAEQSSNGASSGNSQIRFASSDNWGAVNSFSIKVNPLSDPLRHSVTPSIAASGDSVYVTWVDLGINGNQPATNQPLDQFLVRSLHGGEDFDLPVNAVNVSNTGSAAQTPAAIAVGANRVYVAWEDFGSNDPDSTTVSDIFLVWSLAWPEDGVASFTPKKLLSENLSSSQNPAIAVAEDHVYVVWDDFSGVNIPVLRFRHSEDGGEEFGLPFDFQTIGPQPPHIAAEGDNVFIAWEDRDAQTCNLQIFATISKNTGGSFTIPVNISNNPISARNPAISAAEGQGYLAWQGQSGSGDQAHDIIFFDRLSP